MNKRIKKKIYNRCGYKHYSEYKRKVLEPWNDYVKWQKKQKKLGNPITRLDLETLLELGLYTEDEARGIFTIVETEELE